RHRARAWPRSWTSRSTIMSTLLTSSGFAMARYTSSCRRHPKYGSISGTPVPGPETAHGKVSSPVFSADEAAHLVGEVWNGSLRGWARSRGVGADSRFDLLPAAILGGRPRRRLLDRGAVSECSDTAQWLGVEFAGDLAARRPDRLRRHNRCVPDRRVQGAS